jgi:hypothetical protein
VASPSPRAEDPPPQPSDEIATAIRTAQAAT